MGYRDPALDWVPTAGQVVPVAWMTDLTGNDEFFAGSGGGTVLTSESTASTSYGDLSTVGPSVTVTTGLNAIVIISGQMSNATGGDGAAMSFAVSGATSIAASDNNSGAYTSPSANQNSSITTTLVLTGLTAGANTFTAKYRAVTGSTATFLRRHITVIPLP